MKFIRGKCCPTYLWIFKRQKKRSLIKKIYCLNNYEHFSLFFIQNRLQRINSFQSSFHKVSNYLLSIVGLTMKTSLLTNNFLEHISLLKKNETLFIEHIFCTGNKVSLLNWFFFQLHWIYVNFITNRFHLRMSILYILKLFSTIKQLN